MFMSMVVGNLATLATIIPEHVQTNISNVNIHLDPHVNDAFVWKEKIDGVYNAK